MLLIMSGVPTRLVPPDIAAAEAARVSSSCTQSCETILADAGIMFGMPFFVMGKATPTGDSSSLASRSYVSGS